MASTSQLVMLMLLAVTSALGRPGPGGSHQGDGHRGGHDGQGSMGDRDGDGPGPLDNPLNCTTAMELLQGDEAAFATFLSLVDSLNMTDALERPVPPFVDEIRAPTEAFFTAWYAASGTTTLPDVSTLNVTQIRDLQHAVMGLLAPKDMLTRNDTRGGAWDEDAGDMAGAGNMPLPPDGMLQGPGPNGPQLGAESSNSGSSGASIAPVDGAQDGQPLLRRRLFGRGHHDDDDGDDDSSDDSSHGPRGDHDGQGKDWAGSELKCANVTLVAVDEVLEGAGACPLAACLPCSGVEGCSCVDCKCECSA